MDIHEMEAAVEAVLFASGEPVERDRFRALFDMEEAEIKSLMEYVAGRYNERHRGTRMLCLGDSYQLATASEYALYVSRALDLKRRMPLTPAAMEVLAIVAYNEPVTRSYVDQVRGVDSSAVLTGLMDKGLIAEAGRLDAPGRPNLYATTSDFLRTFGISSLSELPKPPVISEAPEEKIS